MVFGDLASDARRRFHDCQSGITSFGIIPVSGFGVPGSYGHLVIIMQWLTVLVDLPRS